MDLPDALYHPDGDAFAPTALTIGPWDAGLQHGGPPSALLARALATHDGAPELRLRRVTVELLRPIPLVPVQVAVTALRQGREAWWLTARLTEADTDRLLAVAHGLRVRHVPVALPPAHTPPRPAPAAPETLSRRTFDFFPTEVAFHRAIDVRIAAGTWPRGPVTAWLRPTVPLLPDEAWQPAARVLCVCDALNGVSPALGLGRHVFPNADLSVHLRRDPVGPWTALQARSTPDEGGSGLAHAVLYDAVGELGLAVEDLVVRER